MESLSDFEKMLPALSRGEKAQILKWVIRELDDDFPGIDFAAGCVRRLALYRSNPDSRMASRASPPPDAPIYRRRAGTP